MAAAIANYVVEPIAGTVTLVQVLPGEDMKNKH